ncbi:MAG: hypothetical protein J6J24_05660 [Clostridia bacterium]|nr:hypothetical protein [Clostridia bacterium]
MSTNYDILNFLNLTCPSLARLYKTTGISYLPENFVFDKEKIKERMFFDALEEEIKYPDFILGEKSEIKKYLKNSQKNIKKIIKNQFFNGFFEKNFENKLKFYFFARQKLTSRLLRRFNSYDFDELRAYREIYHLDPIYDEMFSSIYFENVDLTPLFYSLEQEYGLLYNEKLKIYNSKNKKKKQKEILSQLQNQKENTKVVETKKETAKTQKVEKTLAKEKKEEKIEKTANKTQKIQKNRVKNEISQEK